ncbi:MAG: T9SS type A sorting domain-containing protein [Bacteroidetes bacterium]|nr:T9SS type A sorting domain-containing protein [Bacteroidota bacterium]
MKKNLLLLTIVFVFASFAKAQITFKTNLTLPIGSPNYNIWGTVETKDGGAVTHGYYYDGTNYGYMLIKTNAQGNYLWSKRYYDFNAINFFSTFLVELPDSGFYLGMNGPEGLVGYISGYGIFRLDKLGNIINTYQPSGFINMFQELLLRDMKLIPNTDTLVITHSFYDENGDFTSTGIAKLDNAGTISVISGADDNTGFGYFSATPVESGGLPDGYIATSKTSGGVIKLDNNGNVAWSKFISGFQCTFFKVIKSGLFYYALGTSASNFNSYFLKLDLAGNLVASTQFPVDLSASVGNYGSIDFNLYDASHLAVAKGNLLIEFDLSGNITRAKTLNLGAGYSPKSGNIAVASQNIFVTSISGNNLRLEKTKTIDCFGSNVCSTAPISISSSIPNPVCISQPVTLTQIGGSTAPGGNFAWYTGSCGGTLVGTGNSITITPTTSNVYYVRAEDGCGNSSCTSYSLTTSGSTNATITASSSLAFCPGGSVTLNAPLSATAYQWRQNGVNISGSTGSGYIATTAGNFDCIITTTCGAFTSNILTTSLLAAPIISISPAGPIVICSASSVTLTGSPVVSGVFYQWKLNGTIINGAQLPTYSANSAGTYTLTVQNSSGCSTTSNDVTATISPLTAAITPSGSVVLCAGQVVTFTGSTNFGTAYQWVRNGINISGATNATYSTSNTGTYQVRATEPGGCSVLSNSTVFSTNSLPTATNTATTPTTVCNGGGVVFAANTGTGLTYQWQRNSINVAGATNLTYTATTAGSYRVTITNSNGCTRNSNAISAAFTGTSVTAGVTLVGPSTFCLGAGTYLQETTSIPGYSYQWQLNGVDIVGATSNIHTPVASGNYSVRVTASCGTATSAEVAITISSGPPQPGTISGITQACNPVNNVPFSIAPVPGATSYNWYSLNPAVTVNAPANGTNVTVNLGAATSSTYSLRVEAINACGTSQYQSTTIRRTVSGVTTVTGTNLICTATNGVAYSCNSVSGADSYFWTVPAGATIASGQGTSAITVDFTNSFNGGSVCVSSQLNCGFSATPKCFSVAKGTAPTPGNVSGSSTVCSGGSGNYSIVAIPGVTYNWSVPSGASITSGDGTNAVTVLFPTSFSTGNVCVNITNVCGVTSITKCRGVVTANPSRPASITGNTSGVCNSLQNYSCAASTNATSYLWNVTGGTIQSGQGTQTVSVLWNASGTTGTLNVNGVNACGNGLVRSVSVNLKPSSAASITGNVSACANTAEVYNFTSLYGATNYLWSVNTASGASVTAGQGTTAATIQWATNGGTVYCTPSNVCGSSSTKTLAVNITCRQAGEGIVSESNLFNVTAIPNPFNNELNISSSVYGDGIVLKLSDMLGRVVLTQPLISENTLVQTSQLKNGIYFVEVMNGTEKKTFKVVKTE